MKAKGDIGSSRAQAQSILLATQLGVIATYIMKTGCHDIGLHRLHLGQANKINKENSGDED